MAYPGRQNIYEATIRRMVQEALEQQEQDFRQQHAQDSDEQLLAYLRAWAIRKQHTPWPGEIVGGKFIQERFGSWNRALLLARLPAPKTANQSKSFARVREETEKQKEIYRQRKAKKRFWRISVGFNRKQKRNIPKEFILYGLCNPPCTSL